MTSIRLGSPDSSSESTLTFPSGFDPANLRKSLHPEHPRLLARMEDWDRIRRQIPSSPHLSAVMTALKAGAGEILEAAPLERELTGRRLLSVSREVLKRVLTLGTLYRLTNDSRTFERARLDLIHASGFTDWNPSHFLDTAEMTLALALGYDWLYDALSPDDRRIVQDAIVARGLLPGARSAGEGNHWKEGQNNWTQVCYAGMLAGSLALADHVPELAVQFLRETFANIHRPLDVMRPDGAYPEGPTYWSYGIHFQVILNCLLDSALATNWGLDDYPALIESAVYINLMVGPSGLYYSYADSSSPVGSNPALHWFSARTRRPELDQRERDGLLRSTRLFRGKGHGNRFFPLTMIWLDAELAQQEDARTLPLHWKADGPNPVAVHRSAWDEDALFLGIKGGKPSVAHGHMDIGSFVLDFQGVRWALDLGAQDYHSIEQLGMKLWDRGQNSDRWRIFRLSNFSHNTLIVENETHRVDGFAPIVAFSDHPQNPFTVVDMTEVYRNQVLRALRGARLLHSSGVLIQDDLEIPEGNERNVRWAMMTEAEVELEGHQAVLTQKGKTLHAQILSPENAQFEIVPSDPPPSEFDQANPGTRMLAFHLKCSPGSVRLQVVLSSDPIPEQKAEELRRLPLPLEW